MNPKWKELGIEEGEFLNDSQVICPYCGHTLDDAHEILPDIQDDEVNCTCDNCEKVFLLSYSVFYTTRVIKDE